MRDTMRYLITSVTQLERKVVVRISARQINFWKFNGRGKFYLLQLCEQCEIITQI